MEGFGDAPGLHGLGFGFLDRSDVVKDRHPPLDPGPVPPEGREVNVEDADGLVTAHPGDLHQPVDRRGDDGGHFRPHRKDLDGRMPDDLRVPGGLARASDPGQKPAGGRVHGGDGPRFVEHDQGFPHALDDLPPGHREEVDELKPEDAPQEEDAGDDESERGVILAREGPVLARNEEQVGGPGPGQGQEEGQGLLAVDVLESGEGPDEQDRGRDEKEIRIAGVDPEKGAELVDKHAALGTGRPREPRPDQAVGLVGRDQEERRGGNDPESEPPDSPYPMTDAGEFEGEKEHEHGARDDPEILKLRKEDLGPHAVGRGVERRGHGPDEYRRHEPGQGAPGRCRRPLPSDQGHGAGDEGADEKDQDVEAQTSPADVSWASSAANAGAISRKFSTTSGSNWVPEQRMISLTANRWDAAFR
jgi:hypothetical protein